MKKYQELSAEELSAEYENAEKQYEEFAQRELSLDMSRGKPSVEQLDLSMGMLDVITSHDVIKSENGLDLRNYGAFDGIPETKRLFAELLEVSEKNIFVGGNSSLNLMYDMVSRAMSFGVCGSKPWHKLEKVKFLCPVPGYDRHFGVCETFGIEMINIPMDENGPDMEMVKRLVEGDEAVKGIWCVPKYANPTGVTYSNEVVAAFANLKPKAEDFRIFWDNAYFVHHVSNTPDVLLNIISACEKAGNPDMVFEFVSTSKISFSGAGVSAIATSEKNLAYIKKYASMQTIGYDKINQLRHSKFFKDKATVLAHMEKHRHMLTPKFDVVAAALAPLKELGIGHYTKPNGGYFISFDSLDGCAKRIYELCKKAGVTLTPAGASFPYGKDENDRNIRISPTYPPVSELKAAMELFCICVKLASIEKLR